MTETLPLALVCMLFGGSTSAAVILLSRPSETGRREALGLLALFLLGAGSSIADEFGAFGRWRTLDLVAIPVLRASIFLWPPLVLGYARAKLQAQPSLSPVALAAPVVLAWLCFLLVEITGHADETFARVSWYAFAFQSMVYLALVARLLRAHLVNLKSFVSALPPGSVARVRRLWAVLLVPVGVLVAELALNRMIGETEALRLIGAAARTGSVFAVSVLLVLDQLARPEPAEALTDKARPRPPQMDQATAATLAAQLDDHMRRSKAHRDPLLDLRTLARQTRMTEHRLSIVLNQAVGQNFYDFVNRYRVEEARELLQTTDASVLNVSLEVGFNARSTFYAAFRKRYGQTPSSARRVGTPSGGMPGEPKDDLK